MLKIDSKKILISASTASALFLLAATGVSAQSPISINAPSSGIQASANISNVINNIIRLVYIVAVLVVLYYLIVGAFDWITSGGVKEKIDAARKKITSALIGLAILALSAFILVFVSNILNLPILGTGTQNIDLRLDASPR